MITVADVHKMSPLDRDAMQVQGCHDTGPSLPSARSTSCGCTPDHVSSEYRTYSGYRKRRTVGIVTRTDILKVIELKEM